MHWKVKQYIQGGIEREKKKNRIREVLQKYP